MARLSISNRSVSKPNTSKNEAFTTPERGTKYDTLKPLLQAMFMEFKELSKKKPDGALNKRKVEIVNRLLTDVLTILEDEPTRQYLDLLDEDELPQNSDVLLMLSQFNAAMNAFYERYWIYDRLHGEHKWNTK